MRFLLALIFQELYRPLRRQLFGDGTVPDPGYSRWDTRDRPTPRAVEPTADGLPTPLQVLEIAFPAYPPPRCRRHDAAYGPQAAAEYRRGVLGTWQP